MVANPGAVWKSIDAYNIFIYNTDVSYLRISEMSHMAALHSN